MAKTLYQELVAICEVEPGEGETKEEFALRLALRANNDIHSDDWDGLSEPAQRWVIAFLEAREDRKPLPPLPGQPVTEETATVTETETDGEAEVKPEEKGDPVEETPTAPPTKKAKKAGAKVAAPKKAKKAAAPAKPAKKAKANGKARAGAKGAFALDNKITIVAEANPFRKDTNSAKWFAKHKNGQTVQQAMDAGIPRHHIRWEIIKGFISVA